MTALEIAVSQIGYCESPPDSNKTKYGRWYGMDGVPWCMIFVQWCFAEAGAPLPYKTGSCSELLNWYRENAPERIKSMPEPGDVAIYTFGHTGIVESAAANTVTAIEGNTTTSGGSEWNGGEVARKTRELAKVEAFIRPFGDGGETCLVLPTLRKGCAGDTVRAMQYLLLGWGYSCGRWGADGDFGADTEAAVVRYQRMHGLDADGICGPMTWGRLLGM